MEENDTKFRASPAEWLVLVDEFESSGMSAAAFCRAREIPVWQLYHRLDRMKAVKKQQRGFVEIGRNEPAPSGGLLIEVGRLKIRIERDFDADLLRRVAEVLA